VDWELMVSTLAAEEPWWEPGTRSGYHVMTFGWTVGELVRRAAGMSLGRFVAEELAHPQKADVWIGVPEAEVGRVSRVITPPLYREQLSRFTRTVLDHPKSLQGQAALNTGGFNANDAEVLQAEIGGGGGVATARGLARLFRAVSLGGDGLFSTTAVARMGEVSAASERDATMLIPTRFALGFMKSMDNRSQPEEEQDSVILSSTAFGHVGAGGSLVFVDPANRLSFGYVLNKMSDRLLLDRRGQSLADAVYRSLGYTTNTAGVWV
jgi:CubicO group peptidase (beta-lactamase class C family)